MDITQPHGCWKWPLVLKKRTLGLILVKSTGNQNYTSKPPGMQCRTKAEDRCLWKINLTDFHFHYFRRNKALIEELSTPPPGSSDLNFPTQYSRSFFTQCLACFWKQKKSYWRNPSYTAVRLLFTIVIELMFGTMSWDLGRKTYII